MTCKHPKPGELLPPPSHDLWSWRRFASSAALALLASSCVPYNRDYIGSYTDSMTLRSAGIPQHYQVSLQTNLELEQELNPGHLDEILNSLGIAYQRQGGKVTFTCSKAELFGFVTTVSSNGKASVINLKRGWISVKSLGFAVEGEGIPLELEQLEKTDPSLLPKIPN